MKCTNILLTAIFALMLINTFNLDIIGSANAELSGMDLHGIENALNGIAASIGEIAVAITMK